MGNDSAPECLRHHDNRNVQVRLDYMLLYKNETKAKIIRILETWTNHRSAEWHKGMADRKEQKIEPPEEDLWVTMSYDQFSIFVYGTIQHDTIKQQVDDLVALGHIQRRPHPEFPYGPPQYLLNKAILQKALDKLDIPSNLFDLAGSFLSPRKKHTPLEKYPQGRGINTPRVGGSLPLGTGENTPPSNNRTKKHTEKHTENKGTFVADATPAPLQENVFADDDPEKTVERLPAVHIETASHIAVSDYTNEGGEHARHAYCSEQRPGVSVFLPALAGSDVPPDLHDMPDADQGHPGLSAGLHAASFRDRTDAQTPGDQAVTPSQQTNPDVLAGAASDDGQAPDAAAAAPPSRAPSASGGKGTNGKALLCEPAKVRAALLAFRGYALESAGALINENKAIKAWCALHSEGELALVMGALEQDRYWGKAENREHFTISNFVAETPKMLARLNRRGEPRVLDDGATSEWDFANYIGNGPEDMAAWMRRAEAQEAQGLLNF